MKSTLGNLVTGRVRIGKLYRWAGKWLGATLLVLGFLGWGAAGQAQAPEIGGLLPSGGPRGATTSVRIDGANLKGATLFLGGEGLRVKSVRPSAAGDSVIAEVEVAASAPLGPHDVRIVTTKGVSNGARFWVDLLPNRVIEQPMTESAAPVPIDGAVPSIINSRIATKSARDRFVFHAQAGEVWTFECFADQIRSRMDPILELSAESGVGIRLVQGTWESEPRFAYRFASSGQYHLTVRDSEYNGGPNYTYRLLAAKSPFVSSFSPRGGRPGQTLEIRLQGVNLPTERTSIAIPANASRAYWAHVRSGSAGALILPLLVEAEPVFDAGDSELVRPLPAAPIAVDGVFGHSAQANFSFHAAAGERLAFDLLGRRIGSRIDGSLRVTDAAGKELAVNDDAPDLGKDARLEFSAPTAGDYRVEVRNVEEITGPDCYYRLKVTRIAPDFQVAIATDRLTVPAGGTISLPIKIERAAGFSEAVIVRPEGLPPGVFFRGGLVPQGKSEIEATLTAPPETALSASQIHLIAQSKVAGRSVVREAPAWEQYEHRSIDLLLSVEYSYARPHHLWDMLLLAVTERTDPITVSTTASGLVVTPGGTVEILIHILRHPGAAGEIKLDMRGLPGKVMASALTIPANQSDGKIILTAAPDAPADIANLIVQAHFGNAVCLAPAIGLTVNSKPR